VVFDFTPAQAEAFNRQEEENREAGTSDVTISLTVEQLEAVKRVNPMWTAPTVTVDAGRVFKYRLALNFDEHGNLIKEERPYTSK
jgi:hypothetical protein